MKQSKKDNLEASLEILAKSSLVVFIGLLLSKVFTYAYRIVVVRNFGAETYGLFSLAFMLTGFIAAIASLGLTEGVIRFIPIYRAKKEQNNINRLVSFSFRVLLFSGAFFSLILFFSSSYIADNIFHDSNLTIFLRAFSFILFAQILSGLLFGVIRAHERIVANSFGVNILQNTFKVIFLIFFVFIGISSVIAITGSYLIGAFLTLAFAYFYCKKKIKNLDFDLFRSSRGQSWSRREILSYSWPLIFFGVMVNLFFWADSILIGYFLDASAVGFYNLAVPIALLLPFCAEIFVQLFFPLVTREMSSKNYDQVRELSKQVTKWILLVSLPLFGIIILFPERMISLFFGEGYSDVASVLRILAFGQFFYSLAIISNNLLLAKGKSKLVLANLSIAAILNFILNFILIPSYGLVGAAVSTSVSLIVLSVVLTLENYFINSIFSLRRKVWRVLISCLVSLVFFYFLVGILGLGVLGFLLSTVLFLAIYFVLILLVKALDRNDISVLRSFLRIFRKK